MNTHTATSSPAPETVAIATIATISARIAKGYALAPDEAEHIVRAVVRSDI